MFTRDAFVDIIRGRNNNPIIESEYEDLFNLLNDITIRERYQTWQGFFLEGKMFFATLRADDAMEIF